MAITRSIDAARRRIQGALFASSLARAIRVLEQLAIVPLLLAGWGVQVYGEWLALASIAGFSVITSFGVGHAAASDIVLQHARGEDGHASKTFSTAIILISITILLGFGGLMLLLSVSDLSAVASLLTLNVDAARTIALILSMAILLNLYCEPLGGVLGAAVGSIAPNLIFAGCKLVEVAAVAIGIFYGAGPMSIAIVLVLVSIFSLIIHVACAMKWAPWLSCFPMRLDKAAIGRNLRPAAGFFIIFISMNLAAVNLPRLLVSHVLGATALTAFTIMVTYTKTARSIATMISQSMQVELGRAWATERSSQTRRIAELMVNSALGTVIFLLAIEIASAPLVISAWTHGEVSVSWSLLFALACVALVGAYFDATMLALSAFNRVALIAIWYSTTLAAILGAAFLLLLLTRDVTVIGVCMIAPELVGAWAATRALTRVIGRTRIQPWSVLRTNLVVKAFRQVNKRR